MEAIQSLSPALAFEVIPGIHFTFLNVLREIVWHGDSLHEQPVVLVGAFGQGDDAVLGGLRGVGDALATDDLWGGGAESGGGVLRARADAEAGGVEAAAGHQLDADGDEPENQEEPEESDDDQ